MSLLVDKDEHIPDELSLGEDIQPMEDEGTIEFHASNVVPSEETSNEICASSEITERSDNYSSTSEGKINSQSAHHSSLRMLY